jgi:hypothetical protein
MSRQSERLTVSVVMMIRVPLLLKERCQLRDPNPLGPCSRSLWIHLEIVVHPIVQPIAVCLLVTGALAQE